MSRFVIEPGFWQLFPECQVGVMLVRGINNSEEANEDVRPDIIENLEKQNEAAKQYITGPVLSQCPAVAVWREAFARFKTKKGARASIEALLKRVEKGRGVGPINPMVDLYNAASLQYGLPCGVEDADTFEGDLRLTVTAGGDEFMALGDEENDPTLPGEVCYLDGAGAVCRCWNWRDGQRTMVTEDTKSAFVVFECVDPARQGALLAAMDTLAGWMAKTVGGSVTVRQVLTRDAPAVELV